MDYKESLKQMREALAKYDTSSGKSKQAEKEGVLYRKTKFKYTEDRKDNMEDRVMKFLYGENE
jgi:hypothetical protein